MQTENSKVQIKRRRRKKKSIMGYVYLFTFVFIAALLGLSYLVKSYSPDVDVAIGNNESMPLSESDMEVEIKSVDERLKWIQMEDEMPSVAIREAVESTEKAIKEKKEKNFVEPKIEAEPIFKKEEKIPKPSISEIVSLPVAEPVDFRSSVKTPVIPAPVPSLTKVYLGSFSSVDEAMNIQQKIAGDIPDAMPFIKSYNGAYIVQLGSFSNKNVADTFIMKVREKGYSPKVLYEN